MPREFRHRQAYLKNYPQFDSRLAALFTNLFMNATIEYVKAGAKNIPSLTGQAKASFIAAAKSLGLDTGDINSPVSNNMNQRQNLLRSGNSQARGFGLGQTIITVDKKSARWAYKNTLTSAHNNYPYMDKDQWSAFAEGKEALKAYLATHVGPAVDQLIKDIHNG